MTENELKKKKVEVQVLPEVAMVATPLLILILTSIFRSAISFFTWRWLEQFFPKKDKFSPEVLMALQINEKLIKLVNSDLKNELKHLQFYLRAGVMVSGLHRKELREFFLAEAASELKHCEQFAELVVYLGGIPEHEPNEFLTDLTCPVAILKYVVEMETEVAEIYAERLRQTESLENAATAYCHVFYEEQITDSQKAAWEAQQMVKMYDHEMKDDKCP